MTAPYHRSTEPSLEPHTATPTAARLNELILELPAAELTELSERVARAAVERGVWWERDGRREGIPLTLRPRLMDLSCRGYVHHVAWQVRMGLRRIVRLLAEHPEAAAVLPLEPVEADWFERYRRLGRRFGSPRGERIFCRLDALVRFEDAGWRETLKFMEVNVIGIGGMTYAPAVEAVMLDLVTPRFTERDDELAFDHNMDPRELLLEELMDHARALGAPAPSTIALVDDRSLYTLGGELGRLQEYFAARGRPVLYVDPRELTVADSGDVVAQGRRVDVVYRFLELRELAELEASGENLAGLHAAFARGMVIPSTGGDLEHKSAFEILTDPDYDACFSPEQVRVFREHVLWTRLLHDRRTTGPDGGVVDLLPFSRRERERLVLKPNRSSGGEGVVLGSRVPTEAWERALDAALRVPRSHVVQEASPPDLAPYPVVDADGSARLELLYGNTGVFPGRRGLGVFGRYAPGEVVNISQGGGIAPFLVEVS